MARNLPLGFGIVLVGAILLDKGGHAFASVFTTGSGSAPSVNVAASVPAGLAQIGQVTASMLTEAGAAYGWTGQELLDWRSVIGIESGGNPAAVNKGSRASLIGQFLPENWGKYGPGSNPSSNPTVPQQLDSMGQYIHERYGTPTAALAHEHQYGWY